MFLWYTTGLNVAILCSEWSCFNCHRPLSQHLLLYDLQFEKMIFPVDGTATEIWEWLRTEEFDASSVQNLVKWNAKAMLGVSEADLKLEVPGSEGRRLWALLSTAKTLLCKSCVLKLISLLHLSINFACLRMFLRTCPIISYFDPPNWLPFYLLNFTAPVVAVVGTTHLIDNLLWPIK